MNQFKVLLLALVFYSSTSCTSNTEKGNSNKQNADQLSNSSEQSINTNLKKISLFNDPKLFNINLSSLGIGSLRDWHSDGYGWMSSSPYYNIGVPAQDAQSNNLAIYLESENENYVKTFKLVLNLNNSADKTTAIKKFMELTSNTFKILNIKPPKDLMKSIKNKKVYETNTSDYQVRFIIDKGNIDTWKIIIESQ